MRVWRRRLLDGVLVRVVSLRVARKPVDGSRDDDATVAVTPTTTVLVPALSRWPQGGGQPQGAAAPLHVAVALRVRVGVEAAAAVVAVVAAVVGEDEGAVVADGGG